MPLPPSLRLLASVCLLFCFQTLTAYGWHDKGHEVVAEIAWEQMTPQARAAAVALLQSAPADSGIAALRPVTGSAAEQDREQFIRASVWADAVRKGARKPVYHQALWHFTDFFWEQMTPESQPKQRPDLPPHGDLVTKLPELAASLRQPNAPAVSPGKSTDLAWFLHLMGDVAQPLHCSGRITEQTPAGDEGGNRFCLAPAPVPGAWCLDNLHFFWDHVIEREYGEQADIPALAADIMKEYPRTPQTPLLLGQYEDWARASQRIAVQFAYPPTVKREHAPPPEYRATVKQVSREVMALAGYRLGETLNQVFAAAP